MLAWLGLVRTLSSFYTPSHCILTRQRKDKEVAGERRRGEALWYLLKGYYPHYEDPTLLTSSKPNHLQRPHLQIPSPEGLDLQHVNFIWNSLDF